MSRDNIIRLPTIGDGSTLLPSPQLKRALETMQDLVIIAYEEFYNRPGNSLSLARFQFAYDESSEGKCCTHYDVLVKDHDLNANIPLRLTFGVSKGYEEC